MSTYIGKFKKGMKVGKDVHQEFEMREMTTIDMLEAEMLAPAHKVMNFSAALISMQLVRVGNYEGPFTLGMIKSLALDDFNALRDGLNEVAMLGEDLSPSTQTD
jgi:phage FluMu protein gp41